MNIKILWSWCPKCKMLYSVVLWAVNKLNIDANIEKIEDLNRIVEYDIMATPSLIINGKVVINWRIPSEDEIINIIQNFESC